MHAADPPDEAPLISRREDEPPIGPTIDAPSWLRPGGPAAEPADADRVSATPPEVAPEAERPAPQAPGNTLDASRAWAGETRLDTAGDAARRGPPGGPAADPARARGGAGAIAPGSPLRRIEQFVLLECIGAGGMGTVFAAFDDKLERKVAIKLVATRGGDERARQRLLREAQALARLSHPNVVTVYEAGTLADGELFIAMELVKGQTLRAWQRQPGRSWRDLVAMYAEAGRGLAAAHHSGIVHRDFKPDNVLVGDDGRVRVADFGLAFAAQDTAAGAPRPAKSPDAPGSPPRAQALTAPGRVAGTPGYMAPEQFAGAAVDARADQFSFCAALHEALHGALPDATGAVPAAHGARRRATEPVYPRWLRDVLQRGLARDPGERFATMDALLAELLVLRERTRRRILAAAVVAAGFIATGALSAALRSDDPPPCPVATAVLDGVWDAPVRARSEAAILGTGQPFASSMWSSTRDALERYAQRWLRGQQAACEATYVRHVQSAELFDRRMECLAAGRRSLAAAVEMLQRQPAEAVTHASELLTSLGDIEPCADAGALLAPVSRVESPASAAARPRVLAVRQQLASATALLAVGAVAAAEPIANGAEQLARGIDDDALRAELLYARGRIDLARGKIAESIAVLNQAVALAVSSHHDELPADVWLTLALAAGAREQRPDELESWLSRGEAWLRRLGHPSDSRRILLEQARGNLQYTRGNPRDAVAALSHALDRAEALWGKDDVRLIPMLRDRAAAEARLRDARPAVADGERALALGLAAWGPSYPGIARNRLALGLLYLEQLGDVARSEHEIDLALPQFRDQLGADSIEVANCEQVLSKAGLVRGDYAAALQHAERAEQILALRLGPESPRRGEALNGVGVLRFMRKDYAGSLAAYETAYSILRAAYGIDYPTVAILLSNMGETLLALGRPEPARADFAQALEILQRKVGPDHADLALPLKGLGLASLGAGRFSDARAALEQALALRTRSAAASAPQELAEIRWALARTLRALSREPARARELALAARDAYRGLNTDGDERVREIDRWLAAPGQPAP